MAWASALVWVGCAAQQTVPQQQSKLHIVAPSPNTLPAPSPITTPIEYVLPENIQVSYSGSWAIMAAISVIRGEHKYEWAEAVAYARIADLTGAKLKPALPYDHPELVGLCDRFIADVKSKDGPNWVGIDPRLVNSVADQDRFVAAYVAAAETKAASVLSQASSDPASIVAALTALGRCSTYAKPHLSLIVARANDATPREERNGFWFLWPFFIKPVPISLDSRIAAIEALGRLSAVLPEARAPLLQAFNHPDPVIKIVAIEAAEHWHASDRSSDSVVASALVPLMRSNFIDVRRKAVQSAASMPAASSELASMLTRAMGDEDSAIRAIAVSVFMRPDVQNAADLSAIIGALRDRDQQIRRAAVGVLADRKIERTEVIDTLTAAIDSRDFIVREALTDAMEQSHSNHLAVLDVLQKMASDGNESTARSYARIALKQVKSRMKT